MVTEKIIAHYISNIDKYDYVSNTIKRTYPRCLDTEEDFKLISTIYKYLFIKNGNKFNMKEILRLYDMNRSLKGININVEQKI